MLSGLFEFLFGGPELINIFVLLVSVQFCSMGFFLKNRSLLDVVVTERDMASFEILVFEQLGSCGPFAGRIFEHRLDQIYGLHGGIGN